MSKFVEDEIEAIKIIKIGEKKDTDSEKMDKK